jgi:hypothetical protein
MEGVTFIGADGQRAAIREVVDKRRDHIPDRHIRRWLSIDDLGWIKPVFATVIGSENKSILIFTEEATPHVG